MLWIKAFHIIFVVSWYAGLLYLPRLFVYHATSEDAVSRERFKIMERKLFIIMTIGAVGAVGLGLWLLLGYFAPAVSQPWMQWKLVLVAVLVAFHVYCAKLTVDFSRDQNRHGQRFYRLLNEVPALLLIAIVVLVVVKPS